VRQRDCRLVLLNQSVLVPDRDYRWEHRRLRLLFTLHPTDVVRVLLLGNAEVQCLTYQELLG